MEKFFKTQWGNLLKGNKDDWELHDIYKEEYSHRYKSNYDNHKDYQIIHIPFKEDCLELLFKKKDRK